METIIKLSYKAMLEADYKKIYQTASIQDLKLSLNTIETDIRAEKEYLEECTDYMYQADIRRNISELEYEASYVQSLLDLYNETQQNSLENQTSEQ